VLSIRSFFPMNRFPLPPFRLLAGRPLQGRVCGGHCLGRDLISRPPCVSSVRELGDVPPSRANTAMRLLLRRFSHTVRSPVICVSVCVVGWCVVCLSSWFGCVGLDGCRSVAASFVLVSFVSAGRLASQWAVCGCLRVGAGPDIPTSTHVSNN